MTGIGDSRHVIEKVIRLRVVSIAVFYLNDDIKKKVAPCV